MAESGFCVCLDNEGPLTIGDNAAESTVALAKSCGLGEEIGAKFFARMSNIDDIWGDFHRVMVDPTYSAGHTLKVVLPFFKAMGATAEWLEEYARESLRAVPSVDVALKILEGLFFQVRQISTSYEWYVKAFCDLVGFNFANVYCTRVNGFDAIPISKEETARLLLFMEEVAKMPVIEYDSGSGTIIMGHQGYYDNITQFVWQEVYKMPVGQLLRDVHPVGQTQKREALEEICTELVVPKERVMYVGDSQTDVQCVEFLKGSGLSLMFNGKGRVCEISDLMYIGENARAIVEVACHFEEEGRESVRRYYNPAQAAEQGGGLIATVTLGNFASLHEMSVAKRKEFRGVQIGSLT